MDLDYDLYAAALSGETVQHPEVWSLVPESRPYRHPDLELLEKMVGRRRCLDSSRQPIAEDTVVDCQVPRPSEVERLVEELRSTPDEIPRYVPDIVILSVAWTEVPDHPLWAALEPWDPWVHLLSQMVAEMPIRQLETLLTYYPGRQPPEISLLPWER